MEWPVPEPRPQSHVEMQDIPLAGDAEPVVLDEVAPLSIVDTAVQSMIIYRRNLNLCNDMPLAAICTQGAEMAIILCSLPLVTNCRCHHHPQLCRT